MSQIYSPGAWKRDIKRLGLRPDDPSPRQWQPLVLVRPGFYLSGLYTVSVSSIGAFPMSEARRIGIVNSDQSARRDWREWMFIKDEVAGPEWWAYEVFPPRTRVVDPSNAFYLWAFRTQRLPDPCDLYPKAPAIGRGTLAPEDAIAPQRAGARK